VYASAYGAYSAYSAYTGYGTPTFPGVSPTGYGGVSTTPTYVGSYGTSYAPGGTSLGNLTGGTSSGVTYYSYGQPISFGAATSGPSTTTTSGR
jgi:hypothetical protein